jgi:hypothetical protein
MEESVPEKQVSKDDGEAFLLADFQFMAAYTQESLRLADKRVDVLLALSTAVFGGIIALSAASSTNLFALLVLALFSSIGICIAGFHTFKALLESNILMCEYARALNRIRAYFCQAHPDIREFVMMPTSHTHPPYDWRSSGEAVIELINSLSFGIFFAIIGIFCWCAAMKTTVIDVKSMTVAVPVFTMFVAFAWFSQRYYASEVFKHAETSASKIRKNDKLFASHQELSLASAQKQGWKALGGGTNNAENI